MIRWSCATCGCETLENDLGERMEGDQIEMLRAALADVSVTYAEWVAGRIDTSEAVNEMNNSARAALSREEN